MSDKLQHTLDVLNWRYATKSFNPEKKLSEEEVKTLAESLRLSASSFGLQPWKFLFISDEATKKALLPHSWNQPQVVDCSHHVVFCFKSAVEDRDVDQFLKSISDQRAVALETLEGYSNMMKGFLNKMTTAEKASWARSQAYIALGSFLVVAAELGIDACPMEGVVPAEYDKILGLEGTGYQTAFACPVGHRAENDKYQTLPKVRNALEQVVEFR